MKKLMLILLFFFLPLSPVLAIHGGPAQKPAGLDQALHECESMVGKDSQGRPDHKAMESCMEQKGFSKPSQSPQGEGPAAKETRAKQ